MAHRGDQADVVRFCCSICLDLLKDPVTVPCGHNYCMSCIKSAWDEEDQKKSHSCPLCRQTFDLRPVLLKNTLLADLVEELKKTGLQAAAAAAGGPCYAGPEDVACDFCTERKLKAFKSCLVCLASYCEKHLQPHFKSPAFKKHKLVDPSSVNLQQNVCFRHNEVMKMFCSTDQQCICYLCSVEEHKGHDTVSAAAERTERQQELARRRQRVQQRIQERQRDVKLLRQEVEAINRSAEAVEDGEKIFTELKQQLRTQQRTEVSRVKELQEEFQQEITELKRKDAEMEKLSRTDDHAQFLHRYPSLSKLTEPADSTRPKTNRLRYFEHVTTAVKATRDQIQAFLPETRPSMEPLTRYQIQAFLPETGYSMEPTTRDQIQPFLPETRPSVEPTTRDQKQAFLPDTRPSVEPTTRDQKQAFLPDTRPSVEPTTRDQIQAFLPETGYSMEPTTRDQIQAFLPETRPSMEPLTRYQIQAFLPETGYSMEPTTRDQIQPFLPETGYSMEPTTRDQIQAFLPETRPSMEPLTRYQIQAFLPETGYSMEPTTRDQIQPFLPETRPSVEPTTRDQKQAFLPDTRPSVEPTTRDQIQAFLPETRPSVEPTTRDQIQAFLPETRPSVEPTTRDQKQAFLPETRPSVEPTTRDQIQAFLPETRPSVEPTTRAEFLRYSRQITLDPNTANCQLVLSEENRKITRNINNAPYAKHPERFRNTPQALSKEGLTGRCYWEVEMSRFADVAVAYRSVDRRDCSWSVFGLTEKSWALRCFKGFTFRHDNFSVDRSGPRRSSRVGVYLDHRAGVLSFYSVSETMTLLQRVQTTFTQPLYAGLGLYGFGGDTVELCRLK